MSKVQNFQINKHQMLTPDIKCLKFRLNVKSENFQIIEHQIMPSDIKCLKFRINV
jgi:hypothetical protein